MQEARVLLLKMMILCKPFLLTGEPSLSLISTGNIANNDLEKMVRTNLNGIEAAFSTHRFVEITRDPLVIHE